MTTRPFDDIRALIFAPARTKAHTADGDRRLGRLGALRDWISDWSGAGQVRRPIIALYAAAHADFDDADHTRGRMEAVAGGVAPVSLAAANLGAGLEVFDLALDRPVAAFTEGATMSERECAATIAFGMEAVSKQPDLLALGALGPGIRQSALALVQALTGDGAPASAAVARAKAAAGEDALELLRQLGGRETAALVGAIVAARSQSVPVLLDGASALAAAAVLYAVDPASIAHCRIAQADRRLAGRDLSLRLGLSPILDLDIELDDGTAAAAALSLVKLACALSPEPAF